MSAGFANIEIAGGDTAQPLAIAKRLEVIRPHLRAGADRFLDCGCGAGAYVLALVEKFGLDAHGIEYSGEKVQRAIARPELKGRVGQGNLEALELPSASWDYAMLNEVLEHIPNERSALAEVCRVLKPGGILFVFAPNRWFPFETHGVRMKKTGRPILWVPLIPYLPLRVGSQVFDYWARNYWQSELSGLLEGCGFAVVQRRFVWQTFEGISQHQPRVVTLLKPWFRRASDTLQNTPFLRRFGVSQALVCHRKL